MSAETGEGEAQKPKMHLRYNLYFLLPGTAGYNRVKLGTVLLVVV